MLSNNADLPATLSYPILNPKNIQDYILNTLPNGESLHFTNLIHRIHLNYNENITREELINELKSLQKKKLVGSTGELYYHMKPNSINPDTKENILSRINGNNSNNSNNTASTLSTSNKNNKFKEERESEMSDIEFKTKGNGNIHYQSIGKQKQQKQQQQKNVTTQKKPMGRPKKYPRKEDDLLPSIRIQKEKAESSKSIILDSQRKRKATELFSPKFKTSSLPSPNKKTEEKMEEVKSLSSLLGTPSSTFNLNSGRRGGLHSAATATAIANTNTNTFVGNAMTIKRRERRKTEKQQTLSSSSAINDDAITTSTTSKRESILPIVESPLTTTMLSSSSKGKASSINLNQNDLEIARVTERYLDRIEELLESIKSMEARLQNSSNRRNLFLQNLTASVYRMYKVFAASKTHIKKLPSLRLEAKLNENASLNSNLMDQNDNFILESDDEFIERLERLLDNSMSEIRSERENLPITYISDTLGSVKNHLEDIEIKTKRERQSIVHPIGALIDENQLSQYRNVLESRINGLNKAGLEEANQNITLNVFSTLNIFILSLIGRGREKSGKRNQSSISSLLDKR